MKKALLVGINYKGTSCELHGCINDVKCIEDVLKSKFDYKQENIVVLTDDTELKPTKSNILSSLKNLVTGVTAGDNLCFVYSGHGTQLKDKNNDESSGFDDALYTIDDDVILDDEILNILVHMNGAHITMFFDCCHSGTLSDLAYNLRYKGHSLFGKQQFQMWTEKSKRVKGTACMFSGCLDNQTSADSSFKRGQNECQSNGAFTYFILDCLSKCNYQITNRNLLVALYENLRKHGYDQVPQFSCSRMKLLDSTFTI